MRENRTSIQARRAYAELLRRFIAGRLTNDEFEDGLDEIYKKHGRDRACEDIFAAVWHLYDDCSVHRMDGRHAVGPELRHRIAEWIVFLKSELPYTPPTPHRSSRTQCLRLAISGPVGIVAGIACVIAFAAPAAAGLPLREWSMFGVIAAIMIGAVAVVGGYLTRGLFLDKAVWQVAFDPEHQSPWPFSTLEQRAAVIARPRGLSGGSMRTSMS